jgi:hypothetical protein
MTSTLGSSMHGSGCQEIKTFKASFGFGQLSSWFMDA